MSTSTRRGPSGAAVASVIGLLIIGGAVLAPGTAKFAKDGSTYLDKHPDLTTPLIFTLVTFLAVALIGQRAMGFTTAATVGAVVAAIVLVLSYAPLREHVPGLGPDQPTCPAGQVANDAGKCVKAGAR